MTVVVNTLRRETRQCLVSTILTYPQHSRRVVSAALFVSATLNERGFFGCTDVALQRLCNCGGKCDGRDVAMQRLYKKYGRDVLLGRDAINRVCT